MAFYIKNPETEALARRLAAIRKVGLAEAVHQALLGELERELEQQSLIERGLASAREFRAKGDLEKGLPADKAFIDSLYDDG